MFGSVARGCATAGSDVDLVVMFDDLGDYTQRRELAHQARTAAEQAAGFACDVRVTDRAEWRVRTTQCRSSFEAHIASCAITLMSRPPKSPIDWDKKIGKPATDEQQAVAILAKATHSLITILAYLRPSPSEADALAEDDTDLAHQMQHSRLLSVCEHAQIAMETSLQALICPAEHPIPKAPAASAASSTPPAAISTPPKPPSSTPPWDRSPPTRFQYGGTPAPTPLPRCPVPTPTPPPPSSPRRWPQQPSNSPPPPSLSSNKPSATSPPKPNRRCDDAPASNSSYRPRAVRVESILSAVSRRLAVADSCRCPAVGQTTCRAQPAV